MNREKFYVYIHRRADSLVPFYIGKGRGNRYKDTTGRNKYWQNVANKHGFVAEILYYFDDEKDALNREKELIKSLRDDGFNLTNLTAGGEGTSGFKHSPESRALMGEMRSGSGNAMYGKNHSAETRAKIGARLAGKKNRQSAQRLRRKLVWLIEVRS